MTANLVVIPNRVDSGFGPLPGLDGAVAWPSPPCSSRRCWPPRWWLRGDAMRLLDARAGLGGGRGGWPPAAAAERERAGWSRQGWLPGRDEILVATVAVLIGTGVGWRPGPISPSAAPASELRAK
ncbi:MAG: hypothetical protein R2755_34030 [Acidimicrobiales bacterium]